MLIHLLMKLETTLKHVYKTGSLKDKIEFKKILEKLNQTGRMI